MSGTPKLSTGCLKQIMSDNPFDGEVILQLIDSKVIFNEKKEERYRLLVSDGTFSENFVKLAIQLNHFGQNGRLNKFSVIRIKKHITCMVESGGKARRALIIADMEILKDGKQIGNKIGNPSGLPRNIIDSGNSASKLLHQFKYVPPKKMIQNTTTANEPIDLGNSVSSNEPLQPMQNEKKTHNVDC